MCVHACVCICWEGRDGGRRRWRWRWPGRRRQITPTLKPSYVDTIIVVPLATRYRGGWPGSQRRGQGMGRGGVPGCVHGVPGLLQRGGKVITGTDRKRREPKLRLEIARSAESVGDAVVPAEPVRTAPRTTINPPPKHTHTHHPRPTTGGKKKKKKTEMISIPLTKAVGEGRAPNTVWRRGSLQSRLVGVLMAG